MDIPIKFKFFDKLKLYQDYLKEGSMLEKTKDTYWLCEKSIMFWSYSKDHQHLGVPLSVNTFTKDKRAKTISEIAEKIGVDNFGAIKWVKNKITDITTVERILENLITLELVTKLAPSSKEIAVNLKGFLLGELLFETYEKPGFWSRNFRKYKLALLVFYISFIVLLITVYLVFIEQLVRIIRPEGFVAIELYIGKFLGGSWWSTITVSFLIYLGLRQAWKRF